MQVYPVPVIGLSMAAALGSDRYCCYNQATAVCEQNGDHSSASRVADVTTTATAAATTGWACLLLLQMRKVKFAKAPAASNSLARGSNLDVNPLA